MEPITNLEKYSDTTYVLFNNHYRGKAGKNAATLQHILKAPRPTVPTPSGGPLVKAPPGSSVLCRLSDPQHGTSMSPFKHHVVIELYASPLVEAGT